MKTEKIIGLRHCPVCGSPAVMRKNASKRFQIHCRKCDCCTIWTSKPEAIVKWYNNAAIYESLNGITPPRAEANPEEKLNEAIHALTEYTQNLKEGGIIEANKLEQIATQILKIAKE